MIALVITALVAIEAIGIMVVEVFGSTPQQAKAFELKPEIVDIPEVKTLLGNQGGYNCQGNNKSWCCRLKWALF